MSMLMTAGSRFENNRYITERLFKACGLNLQQGRRHRSATTSMQTLQMTRSLQKELSCCPINVMTVILLGTVSIVIALFILNFIYYHGYWLFFIFIILTFVFGALLVFTFLMRHYFLKLKWKNRTPGLNMKTRRQNLRQADSNSPPTPTLLHLQTPVHFQTIVEINEPKQPHSTDILCSDLPNYNQAILLNIDRRETETPPPSYKQALLISSRSYSKKFCDGKL